MGLPVPDASLAQLLDWAHSPEPPTPAVRAALPWLQSDREITAYLEELIRGNIDHWRFGPLFWRGETVT